MSVSPHKQAKVKIPLHLQLTQQDWEEICLILNPAEIKVFMWIRTGDPYGDRELDINCGALGKRIGLHKSSVSRALKSLDSKKLIEISFEDVKVSQKISNRRLTLLTKEARESYQEQKEEQESVAPVQHPMHQCNTEIYKDRGRKTSSNSSTFLNPLNQGEGGEEKILKSEPERTESKSASLASKPKKSTRQVKATHEDKSSAAPCNDLLQMLDFLSIAGKANSLLTKMEELEIKPCQGYSAERIAGVIKECDISQLWGALRHIENTWETIHNPTAIFCSKASKMPIEVDHRLPDFDRSAYDTWNKGCTDEEEKEAIAKAKAGIAPVAGRSSDKRVRKFADLIQSMPKSQQYTADLDSDYAAEQRRLARQIMEGSGDATG